jgi:ribonuclease BN (tRNA processing enzyme)
MIRITFLGTNGWYDTAAGSTPSVLVQTPEANLILDAGLGLHKATDYLDPDLPTWLLLTHFHFDHIFGLHTLLKFPLQQGLFLVSHPGSKALFQQVLNEPFSVPWQDLPYAVQFLELIPGLHVFEFGKVETRPLRHSIKCQGYRLEVEDRVVAYCSDTGWCPEAVTLGRGADVLITECANPPGHEDGGWGHLNPTEAARIAHEAQAKALYLMHFNPYFYPTLAQREAARTLAQELYSPTHVATDGLQVELA